MGTSHPVIVAARSEEVVRLWWGSGRDGEREDFSELQNPEQRPIPRLNVAPNRYRCLRSLLSTRIVSPCPNFLRLDEINQSLHESYLFYSEAPPRQVNPMGIAKLPHVSLPDTQFGNHGTKASYERACPSSHSNFYGHVPSP